MEKNFKRTTVTAALPYANGPVHIGHLAGVYVPADIYVRYLRLKGRQVAFIGGSDEHGVPVTIRARKEGITVQQVVDRYHELIKDSFRRFGISFDIYSRTTSPTHHKLASDFFRKLYDEGKFVEKVSEQFYDEQTGHFLTDRNIRGECPRCHAADAYGDQCEKCGATLSPEELINPYNAETGNPLVKRATKHWYLPLDQYQPWLEQWILQDHKEWRSNVYGQQWPGRVTQRDPQLSVMTDGGSRCVRIHYRRHSAQPPPGLGRAHRRAGNDERQACLVVRQPASNLL